MTDVQVESPASSDGDLTELLGELRVLLPTAQLLSAFLITVPFTAGFATIMRAEKHVFLATFALSMTSVILLSAPAIQHRLIRPLVDRVKFKHYASRQVVLGAVALACALVLVTQLVLSEVMGHAIGTAVALGVAALIAMLWGWIPYIWRKRRIV